MRLKRHLPDRFRSEDNMVERSDTPGVLAIASGSRTLSPRFIELFATQCRIAKLDPDLPKIGIRCIPKAPVA